MKIAVLDDWVECARDCCDWNRLGINEPGTNIAVDIFHDTISGKTLVQRLQPYNIICIMRERTPIDARLMDQLPNLRGIITSGMRNAALDIAAAKTRGIMLSGTESPGHATAELAFTLIAMQARQLFTAAQSMAPVSYTHLTLPTILLV